MLFNKIKRRSTIKLLVINYGSFFGGAEKSIIDILDSLSKKYDVEIVWLIENKNMEKKIKKRRYNYFRIDIGNIEKTLFGFLKIFYFSIKTFFKIIKIKPDIIITNTNRSHLIGSIASAMSFKKCFWILHDYYFNRIAKNILKPLAKKIICVSENLKDYYSNNKNNSKYVIIPNGLDMNIIKKKYREIKDKQKEHVKEKFIIGFATARFDKWKGLTYLIDSFNKFIKEYKVNNAELVIAGEPQKYDYKNFKEMKKNIKMKNLERHVKFVGWVKDIYDFFYRSDIVVLTSKSKNGGPESFGRTIIESWSVKTPVISTRCGGPESIIESGKNGFLVDEDDIDEMAGVLYKLYSDKSLRNKLGENGYSKIMEKYCLDKITKKYKEILSK